MSALTTKPKALTMNVREQARGLVTPLRLHWGGVGALALLTLYLLAHMAFAWQRASTQDASAIAEQQVELQAARIAAKPLQGLDGKLKMANEEATAFEVERLPVSYSEIATELGALTTTSKVRYTRATYTQTPVQGDSAEQLTQVVIDAGLSGDYRGLMLFINGLERDKVFFLITAVGLTGQQSGQVNLRIRIVTYLRGTESAEDLKGLQMPEAPVSAAVTGTAAAPASGGAQ